MMKRLWDKVTIKMKAQSFLEPRVPHVAENKMEAYALELKRAYKLIRFYQILLILTIIGVSYAIFKH